MQVSHDIFEQLQYLRLVFMFAFGGVHFGSTRVTLYRQGHGGNFILTH